MTACWRCDQIRAAIRDDRVLGPIGQSSPDILNRVIEDLHRKKHVMEGAPC